MGKWWRARVESSSVTAESSVDRTGGDGFLEWLGLIFHLSPSRTRDTRVAGLWAPGEQGPGAFSSFWLPRARKIQ